MLGPLLVRLAPRRRGVRAVTRLRLARVPRPLEPAERRVWRRVGRAMDLAGGVSGCAFVDVETGELLYARGADTVRVTASVQKLLTAAVAIERLGPDRRLRTEVRARRLPDARGVLRDDLFLRGAGDPTLGSEALIRSRYAGRGTSIFELARRLVETTGLRRLDGAVVGDGAALEDGPERPYQTASALTFDLPAHEPGAVRETALEAAHALARALRELGVEVAGKAAAGPSPIEAFELAGIDSPPLVELVALMFGRSECGFAEQLTKLLGLVHHGEGSTRAGAEVISRTLAEWGVSALVADGSGFGSANHISPADLARLLRRLTDTPTGRMLGARLPVAGRTGTLSHRMRGTSAQGRCAAKTGTLPRGLVSNLAGWCEVGGGRVSFAVMMGGLDFNVAQLLQDSMLAAVATLELGSGHAEARGRA